MITDINELIVGKNYLVKVKTWVVRNNKEAHLIGKFKGFIEDTINSYNITNNDKIILPKRIFII